MDDQASVSGGRSNSQNGHSEGVVGNLADFANDVSSLAELQFKLTAMDAKEATQRAMIPLVVAAAGAAMLLGCIPVAVAGAALLIGSALGISLAWSLLGTAVALMIAAGGAAAFALGRLVRSFEVFRRSQEELQRNISWIRTVVVHSGRSAPKRRW